MAASPGMRYASCVIFGGAGFIGSHTAKFLAQNERADTIFLADINSPKPGLDEYPRGRVRFVDVDVRRPVDSVDMPKSADLIINLAAVHREPGHDAREYFETNIRGAENVCAWAEKAGCEKLIFTSSIAPYGPSELEVDEGSLPVPGTPYGASKLVAEKVHMAWQRGGSMRKLVIVRPGVVFGAGEGGNVSRLVRAVIRRYFAYMGNKSTRKAGGYVKELVYTMFWALERLHAQCEGALLYNFTMDPAPTVEDYVQAICRVAGINRYIPNVPFGLLYPMSFIIEAIARPLGIVQPISPVRVRKLVRSNNIRPTVLRKEAYQPRFTLEEALADWKGENPLDWKA